VGLQDIYKRHNKTLLLYHLVFPAKYRREVFTDEVEESLKIVCVGISLRYEINFIEIGMEADHVHFLVQSVPIMPVSKIVVTIKSITAKEIFRLHNEVKDKLWGGNLWTSGYYANTVGQYASKDVIQKYIAEQGHVQTEYKKIYDGQLRFDF
jgi:REP element-mobilizing transposase RayT